MDKINPILITNENDEVVYTLEFSRETVSEAERAGFDVSKIEAMPMSMIPLMFFYAFKMHHPTIKKSVTDRILFDEIGGISKALGERLQELYYAPFEALLGEEGKEVKNSKMKVKL